MYTVKKYSPRVKKVILCWVLLTQIAGMFNLLLGQSIFFKMKSQQAAISNLFWMLLVDFILVTLSLCHSLQLFYNVKNINN